MGSLINIGKSKARIYVERKTGVTFDDVEGMDKAELMENFSRLGARIPEGILLVGSPVPARR